MSFPFQISNNVAPKQTVRMSKNCAKPLNTTHTKIFCVSKKKLFPYNSKFIIKYILNKLNLDKLQTQKLRNQLKKCLKIGYKIRSA